MKHSYLMTNKNGIQWWNIQNHKFTNKQMLDAFKEQDVVKVEYHRPIPNNSHLCSCGNIVEGTNENKLCGECRDIFDHNFDYEL